MLALLHGLLIPGFLYLIYVTSEPRLYYIRLIHHVWQLTMCYNVLINMYYYLDSNYRVFIYFNLPVMCMIAYRNKKIPHVFEILCPIFVLDIFSLFCDERSIKYYIFTDILTRLFAYFWYITMALTRVIKIFYRSCRTLIQIVNAIVVNCVEVMNNGWNLTILTTFMGLTLIFENTIRELYHMFKLNFPVCGHVVCLKCRKKM